MRIVQQCRLVDVLGEWGIHEGGGRLQLPAGTFEGDERLLKGVELALIYRCPLAWRILAGMPVRCFRVAISPEDVPALVIANGRTAEDWTTTMLENETESGEHVRAQAERPEIVAGPLTCTAQMADGRLDRVKPPIVIFDGWHRAAAWISQLRRGAAYPISAGLIVTTYPVKLLGNQ
jgi:hypothetical protein